MGGWSVMKNIYLVDMKEKAGWWLNFCCFHNLGYEIKRIIDDWAWEYLYWMSSEIREWKTADWTGQLSDYIFTGCVEMFFSPSDWMADTWFATMPCSWYLHCICDCFNIKLGSKQETLEHQDNSKGNPSPNPWWTKRRHWYLILSTCSNLLYRVTTC